MKEKIFMCRRFMDVLHPSYNEETAHLLGTTDEWKGGNQ